MTRRYAHLIAVAVVGGVLSWSCARTPRPVAPEAPEQPPDTERVTPPPPSPPPLPEEPPPPPPTVPDDAFASRSLEEIDSPTPAEPDSFEPDAVLDLLASAEQGDAEAQFMIGSLYAEGTAVDQDFVEAARWFRRSADQGYAQSFLPLASAYFNGQGVPQDFVSAHLWFNIAAARLTGDDRALAVEQRTLVQTQMSESQVAEAQRLARQWSQTSGRSELVPTQDRPPTDRPAGADAERQLRTTETLERLTRQIAAQTGTERRSDGAYYGGSTLAAIGGFTAGWQIGKLLADERWYRRDKDLFVLGSALSVTGLVMMAYGGTKVPIIDVSDSHVSVGFRWAWGGPDKRLRTAPAN